MNKGEWCGMNTAALADKLGVSSRTVQRWIKQLDIPCKKNEHGHYIFDENDIPNFLAIQESIKNISIHEVPKQLKRKGVTKVSVQTRQMTPSNEGLFPDYFQLTKLLDRIERNEQEISRKASEVVSYQLLQHRKEIDELQNKVVGLEEYIKTLEKDIEQYRTKEEAVELEQIPELPRKSRKSKVFGFSF